MAEQKPLVRVLAESAVAAVIAPGVLLLLGWSEVQAYQGRLGLDDPAAMPLPTALVIEGFSLLVGTAVMLALIYVLGWLMFCLQAKRWVPLPGLAGFPLLAWLAVASCLTAAQAFISIGKDLPVLLWGLTIVDLTVAAAVAIVASFLMLLSMVKTHWAEALTGNTVSGSLFMSLLAVGGLIAGASMTGTAHGSDAAWGCKPFTGLHMDAAGIERTATYRLISHQGGFYFVRDVSLPGTNQTAKAVPESQVRQVEYIPLERTHDCGHGQAPG